MIGRAGVLLLALLVAGSCRAADWDLRTLMQALAAQQTGTASFVETKYLQMLDRPLKATGTLFFQAPDQLEKRTLTPRHESLLLVGDVLTLDRAGRERTVALSSVPDIAVFIEGLRATLMGDEPSLRQRFALTLSGSRAAWQLVLQPRDAGARRLVDHIDIGGSGAAVQRVAIFQADGDHSVMTITPRATSR